MNDLDLRAALDRDADLVGEPSPDLLDQLLRRRQHQRRQRATLVGAVAAVVLVAAGVPVGVSLAARSHAAPATGSTSPPDLIPPIASFSPPPNTAGEAPPCPTTAALAPLLPVATAGESYSFDSPEVHCSGQWAVAFPLATFPEQPGSPAHAYAVTQLYHWAGGSWAAVDRQQPCDDHEVPAQIYHLACESN
jgi:hypothetical protein